MSSLNISTSEIDQVNAASLIFTEVWCYLMIIFGLIGHTLSIYVFTRRSLSSNPCSCYFLAATFSGISVVTMNVFLRLLQVVYKINIYLGSIALCRLLTWLFMWNRYWSKLLSKYIRKFIFSSF